VRSVPKPLTIEEFHRSYSGKKPNSEFLRRAGYKTGSEVELRIDPDWTPVPDLIATRKKVEQPYPTTPVEVVIELAEHA
jgi:hypothetical protein